MERKVRMVTTAGGRKLALTEAGRPDGVPVIVLHGTPGSSLLAEDWVEDAIHCGIRLLSYDRPGYGASDPDPGRAVAGIAGDVTAIAQQLNLNRLAVWGVSGGGPHALACAALLPELVGAVAALSSLMPYGIDGVDRRAGMDDGDPEFGAALAGRSALEKYIETDAQTMLNAPQSALIEAFRSLACPADAAFLQNEDRSTFLLQWIRQGIQNSRAGWVDDDLAFVKPWGFALEQITVPVLLMHGAQDKIVPLVQGQWLAQNIPAVEARFFAEEGHLSLTANRIGDVHAWLVEKMMR